MTEVEVWLVNAPCADPSQITPDHPDAYRTTTPVETLVNHGYRPEDVIGRRFRGVMNANGRISDFAPLEE